MQLYTLRPRPQNGKRRKIDKVEMKKKMNDFDLERKEWWTFGRSLMMMSFAVVMGNAVFVVVCPAEIYAPFDRVQ